MYHESCIIYESVPTNTTVYGTVNTIEPGYSKDRPKTPYDFQINIAPECVDLRRRRHHHSHHSHHYHHYHFSTLPKHMSSSIFGTLAALSAPLVMVFGLYIWEKHWKRGSPFALNLFKCCLASCGFLVASYAARSEAFFPTEIFTIKATGFLFLSSAIGILIGDWAWLEAQQKIGTLRVVLVDTTKPFLAALLGWFLIDEQLRWEAFGGMALTVGGVLLVSLEKESKSKSKSKSNPTTSSLNDNDVVQSQQTTEKLGHTKGKIVIEDHPFDDDSHKEETNIEGDEEKRIDILSDAPNNESQTTVLTNTTIRYGYFMATLNVAFDTYGSLLTKKYGVHMTTWEISLLRFGFAGAVMLVVVVGMHVKDAVLSNKNVNPDNTLWYKLPHLSRHAWSCVIVGVALVTFLTPALSNYSLFQIPLALAITLGSIGPLYALPLDWAIQGNMPTTRSIVGCLLAIGGIVVLAMRGTDMTV